MPRQVQITAGWRDDDIAAGAGIARAKMAQRELDTHAIPLTQLRKWDAQEQLLPAAATGTYLGLVTGTIGSDPVTVQAGDLKAAGATTRRAAAQIILPNDYEAGQSVTIRIWAGMKTHVADTTCTVDVECYKQNKDLTVGSDLCATVAQTINSLVFGSVDFTITPTTLSPGDALDVRFSIACNDAASGSAVIPTIAQIELLADLR